jgi:hypothetical protein
MRGKCKREAGGAVKGVVPSQPAPAKQIMANVESEAKARKRGGKVEGMEAKKRLDKPARKSGGRVGSDKTPMTSAKKTGQAGAHKTTNGGDLSY